MDHILMISICCLTGQKPWKGLWGYEVSNCQINHGNLLLKLFRPTVRKNCSSDREKLLKFEAEGQEFAKILQSLEQCIQTVKGQNNFW